MEEEWENIINRYLDDYQPRLIRNHQVFNEYAMEVPRDTIYYIKPYFSDKVTMSFSFDSKRKRKRCINI